MQTFSSVVAAYDALSVLTAQYSAIQEVLDYWRKTVRVMKDVAAAYKGETTRDKEICEALARVLETSNIERNRLYAQSKRLADEMSRINSLIQNGAIHADEK